MNETWCTNDVSPSHGTHVNVSLCGYERVVPHVRFPHQTHTNNNEFQHTYKWVMALTWKDSLYTCQVRFWRTRNGLRLSKDLDVSLLLSQHFQFQVLGFLTGILTIDFGIFWMRCKVLTLFCETKNSVVICRASLLEFVHKKADAVTHCNTQIQPNREIPQCRSHPGNPLFAR